MHVERNLFGHNNKPHVGMQVMYSQPHMHIDYYKHGRAVEVAVQLMMS